TVGAATRSVPTPAGTPSCSRTTAGSAGRCARLPLVERVLEGKVAIVTGASRGIGAAIASAFADAGAAVMIASRKQDSLDATAAAIVATTPGAAVETFAANAGEPDQARACVDATMERLGAVDILVNNAGTNPVYGPLVDLDLGVWDKIQ